MTHDHGKVYQDWRRSEAGIVKLQEELAASVTHVPVSEYAVGSAKHEALWAAIEQNQRFSFPTNYEVNV